MYQFSQHQLKAAPVKGEHLVRKIELDSKVAVGRAVNRHSDGRLDVQLLDSSGLSAGKIIQNVIVLPNRNTISGSCHETWDSFSADEIIERSAKYNPIAEVGIA